MKLSPIWDYYTETDDPKYAQCKICKEKKLLGCNNTYRTHTPIVHRATIFTQDI